MDTDLTGRTALVTGASRGIGRGIALALAENGADVVVASRSMAELEELAAEIRGLGRRAAAIRADTMTAAANVALFEEAEAALGPISILVNNAGGGGTYIDGGNDSLQTISPEAASQTFALNVLGPLALTQAAAASMAKQGGGSIINLSSRLARTPNPSVGVYSAAKSAVQSLTETLAVELGPHGIRVNAIAPGGIETGNMDRILGDPDLLREYLSSIPLGRLGKVDDAAKLVLFLVSDAAAWISGATVLISGGRP
ncbi:MAG: SDR family NAD(P)-dependent oxidoreductase [Microbacterium sp.]